MSQVIQVEPFVDGQKFRRFNLNLLFWSFLAMFADGYDIRVMGFAAPELSRFWDLPPAAFKWVLTAHLFGILIGAPLLGWVGDRYGRKTAILICCTIYGLATLAVLVAAGIDQVLLLRVVAGIGIGGLMPNTIALNSELSPRRLRATLVVLMFTGITLGSGTPGLVAAKLLPIYGWEVLFLIGGVAPLVIAACLAFTLPESIKFLALRGDRGAELLRIARRMRGDVAIAHDDRFVIAQSQTASAVGIGELFRGRFAIITPVLWICFCCSLMANFFLNSWTPLLFEGIGMSPERAALTSSMYDVGGTLCGVLVSVVLARFGFMTTAVLFTLAAPAIAAIGLGGISFGFVSVLAMFAGFGVLGAQFCNNASAGIIYPTAIRSKGVGMALGVGRVGSIVGPLVGGVLIGMNLPMSELFLVASIPMFVGLVGALVLARLWYRHHGKLDLDEMRTS